ncbi:MAG: efflux RND transporter periplasmic adaptor subunit [Bdellovibrio sp.]|nr:efflux RND transporter periplasmic adaptor subunit [Bdellovibrio sp.]
MRFNFLIIALLISTTVFSQQDHSLHEAEHIHTAPLQKDEARIPIDVSIEQQMKIGLKLSKAEKKKVEHMIRTVGIVTVDQTKEAHIHTKIKGWIEQIYADYTGRPIKRGEPLFELYSPDLVSTQEEYLSARKQGGQGLEISNAALERLKLWGVPQSELDRLKTTRKPKRTITFTSPVSGVIVNKTAIRGMYINPEMELYHIADLSRIWIIVTLYENDVATIATGDEADIQLPYNPNKVFKGKISYIYPEIELETRTGKARIEINNPDQKLKPGMFANVKLKKNLGESVVVPDDSVIDTGTRKIVFAKIGPARFEPREVKVGPRVDDNFIILMGLQGGEDVVSSANFLIDAESKLQAAIKKGSAPSQSHGGHGEK